MSALLSAPSPGPRTGKGTVRALSKSGLKGGCFYFKSFLVFVTFCKTIIKQSFLFNGRQISCVCVCIHACVNEKKIRKFDYNKHPFNHVLIEIVTRTK